MRINIKKYVRFHIILLIIFIYGCTSAEEQQQCLKESLNKVKNNPEVTLIRRAANDTITKWSKNNLRGFSGLMKVDSAIFFNEDNSKAILLVLKIDPNKKAVFDSVKMLAAEKIDGQWYFYAASLPLIIFDRSENQNNTPYTFEELSKLGQKGIIRRGYYKRGTCNLNYQYVNDWFKQPLAEYHQDFLYGKVE